MSDVNAALDSHRATYETALGPMMSDLESRAQDQGAALEGPDGQPIRRDQSEKVEDMEDGVDAQLDELEDRDAYDDLWDAVDDDEDSAAERHLGRLARTDPFGQMVEMYEGALTDEEDGPPLRRAFNRACRDWACRDTTERVVRMIRRRVVAAAQERVAENLRRVAEAEGAMQEAPEVEDPEAEAMEALEQAESAAIGDLNIETQGADFQAAMEAVVEQNFEIDDVVTQAQQHVGGDGQSSFDEICREVGEAKSYRDGFDGGERSRVGLVMNTLWQSAGRGLVSGFVDGFTDTMFQDSLGTLADMGIQRLARGHLDDIPIAGPLIQLYQGGFDYSGEVTAVTESASAIADTWNMLATGPPPGQEWDWTDYVGLVLALVAEVLTIAGNIVAFAIRILGDASAVCFIAGALCIILGLVFGFWGLGFLVPVGQWLVNFGRILARIVNILEPIELVLKGLGVAARAVAMLMVPVDALGQQTGRLSSTTEDFSNKVGARAGDQMATDARGAIANTVRPDPPTEPTNARALGDEGSTAGDQSVADNDARLTDTEAQMNNDAQTLDTDMDQQVPTEVQGDNTTVTEDGTVVGDDGQPLRETDDGPVPQEDGAEQRQDQDGAPPDLAGDVSARQTRAQRVLGALNYVRGAFTSGLNPFTRNGTARDMMRREWDGLKTQMREPQSTSARYHDALNRRLDSAETRLNDTDTQVAQAGQDIETAVTQLTDATDGDPPTDPAVVNEIQDATQELQQRAQEVSDVATQVAENRGMLQQFRDWGTRREIEGITGRDVSASTDADPNATQHRPGERDRLYQQRPDLDPNASGLSPVEQRRELLRIEQEVEQLRQPIEEAQAEYNRLLQEAEALSSEAGAQHSNEQYHRLMTDGEVLASPDAIEARLQDTQRRIREIETLLSQDADGQTQAGEGAPETRDTGPSLEDQRTALLEQANSDLVGQQVALPDGGTFQQGSRDQLAVGDTIQYRTNNGRGELRTVEITRTNPLTCRDPESGRGWRLPAALSADVHGLQIQRPSSAQITGIDPSGAGVIVGDSGRVVSWVEIQGNDGASQIGRDLATNDAQMQEAGETTPTPEPREGLSAEDAQALAAEQEELRRREQQLLADDPGRQEREEARQRREEAQRLLEETIEPGLEEIREVRRGATDPQAHYEAIDRDGLAGTDRQIRLQQLQDEGVAGGRREDGSGEGSQRNQGRIQDTTIGRTLEVMLTRGSSGNAMGGVGSAYEGLAERLGADFQKILDWLASAQAPQETSNSQLLTMDEDQMLAEHRARQEARDDRRNALETAGAAWGNRGNAVADLVGLTVDVEVQRLRHPAPPHDIDEMRSTFQECQSDYYVAIEEHHYAYRAYLAQLVVEREIQINECLMETSQPIQEELDSHEGSVNMCIDAERGRLAQQEGEAPPQPQQEGGASEANNAGSRLGDASEETDNVDEGSGGNAGDAMNAGDDSQGEARESHAAGCDASHTQLAFIEQVGEGNALLRGRQADSERTLQDKITEQEGYLTEIKQTKATHIMTRDGVKENAVTKAAQFNSEVNDMLGWSVEYRVLRLQHEAQLAA